MVHEYVIGNRQLDLQQAQADEIKGKAFGLHYWMAMAMMVSTRLWLGGAISPKRDLALIEALADQIRQMGAVHAVENENDAQNDEDAPHHPPGQLDADQDAEEVVVVEVVVVDVVVVVASGSGRLNDGSDSRSVYCSGSLPSWPHT